MSTSQHPHQHSRSSHTSQNQQNKNNMKRSNGVSDRLRNEAESWVEISSQPSSSSISSIDNEIVTTGLRVSEHPSIRRRRRSQNQSRPQINTNINRQRSSSSQEEYEESESEPDHIDIITSSNEISPPVAIPARLSTRETYDAESEDDDDENGTALGIGRGTTLPFTPQPNAFSHPPSSQSQSHRTPAPTQGSYFPRQVHSQPRPQSYPSRNHTTSRNTSFNSYARPPVDHDAALRASLTTLLSCAAAARGLPKSPGQTATSNEPMGLRIVPESELLGTSPHPTANISRPLSSNRSKSKSSQDSQDEVKRKASQTKQNTRALKKKKNELMQGEEAFISPTLLTWVMSAGVVVLVSVVGFGAGYVIGREVGRQEASVLGGWNGSMSDGSCGREVVRSGSGGLRRFKWGGSVARSIVA
ncbi:ed4878a3-b50b-461e-bd73-a6b16ef81c17 [Sclerotinia trifoliorum]|uniref:Ed4878a3-b50b-461e-bd73-a6b16ef81c17 n=1 Tax=Sclerotinia trifoliorum TaxID=28548 RepID=A0A8H2ZV80_9HELO|nr:ed4878a3-b50b-461e-bd73-a6b16ef81c17 [Sclerotinia trifoliorum]